MNENKTGIVALVVVIVIVAVLGLVTLNYFKNSALEDQVSALVMEVNQAKLDTASSTDMARQIYNMSNPNGQVASSTDFINGVYGAGMFIQRIQSQQTATQQTNGK